MKKINLIVPILVLLIPVVHSLTFTTDPAITPVNPVSNNTLDCSFVVTGTGTLTANVSWFNGSVSFFNETGISCVSGNQCGTSNDINGTDVFRGNNFTCNVTVSNTTSLINASDFVNITNANPVITNPLTNITVIEDQAYSNTATATDAESDTLSWLSNDLNASPDLFTIVSGTGLVSFTPTESDVGNHTVDIVALDGNDGSDTVRIVYWVKEFNDFPEFSPSLSNQSATEDTLFYYEITGSDEESDAINFTISAPTLSNLQVVWLTATTANITFSTNGGAPTGSDVGNHTVNVTVYETGNTTQNTSVTFNLEINSSNDAPELENLTNQTATQGGSFVLNITANDSDNDDTLNFTITSNCSLNNPWNITTTNSSSNASAYINITNLNNSHVVCRFVNITVTDGELQDSQVILINITNTNDPPELFNISTYAGNTAGNNATNLSGAFGVQFTYKLNFTDIDNLTYEGESLSFSTNNSNFSPDSNGIISFNPNNSIIGNHSVLINITDDGGLTDNLTLTIEIVNNTVPVLSSVGNQSCAEDTLCTITIDAVDPDSGENLSFSSNQSLFSISYLNDTAGLVNFTPTQSDIGNYSVNITVTDSLGAIDWEIINFEINNTNDAPFFDGNRDNVTDNIVIGLVVENKTYTLDINATDYDINLGDSLTFNSTYVSGANASMFNLTKFNSTTARIQFKPSTSDDGNYTINITVNDTSGATDWQLVNFTVYNQSIPPDFDFIQPYYNSTTNTTHYNWTNASNYPNRSVNINITENITITFDANVTDNDTTAANLSFAWYLNGSLNTTNNGSSTKEFNYTFNFFSANTYNITLVVIDNFFSNRSFEWIVDVDNSNRPPELLNNLENFTGAREINSTSQFINYFGLSNNTQHFYDPDDDTNGDSEISGGETFSLSITATSCGVATITISQDDITIEPTQVGICLVNFTATDSDGETAVSNEVRIQVGEVPEGSGSSGSSSSSGGGGGGGGGGSSEVTRRVPIPREIDKDVPKGIELVLPGRVIMYENRDMRVPIILKNNWDEPLQQISLGALSDNEVVEMSLQDEFISRIEVGEEFVTELFVSNYREEGPYEITIFANVSEPNFTDSGTIFINSLEQTSAGDELETKLSFAKDLFSEHIECQELNELLAKAETSKENREFDAALNILDAAINGCKFLLNAVAEAEEEQPDAIINLGIAEVKQSTAIIASIAIGIITFLSIILLIFMKRKEPEDF